MPTFILDVKTQCHGGAPGRTKYAIYALDRDSAVTIAERVFGHPVIECVLADGQMTNGDYTISGVIPCETDPNTGYLSTLLQPFHAKATVTVGSRVELTHVCQSCAERWHTHKEHRDGVRWS